MVTRKAKKAGTCDGCGCDIDKGAWIVFYPATVATTDNPEAQPARVYHQDCKPTGNADADADYWQTRDPKDRARIMQRIYGRKTGSRWSLTRGG